MSCIIYSWFDPASGSFEKITDIMKNVNDLTLVFASVVTLILSLICCLFGFRLVKTISVLTGFLAGSLIAYLFVVPHINQGQWVSLLVTLAGGSILAALSWHIYKAGLFVLAFVLAFSAGQTLIPFEGLPGLICCIFLAGAAGILVLKFLRPAIIAVTAIFGATQAAVSLPVVAGIFHQTLPGPFQERLALTAALSCLGILVQHFSTKNMAS